MEGLFGFLGWETATGGKKAPPFSTVCAALGVQIDVSEAHLGRICATNKPERLASMNAEVQDVLASGHLTSGAAASLRGRFQFAVSQTFGKFGVLPLKVLSGRADGVNKGVLLGAALQQSLAVLLRHITTGPPRVVLLKDNRKPVVAFTDGAVEAGKATCGGIVFAEEWSTPRFFALAVPSTLCEEWLAAGTLHQVAQSELLPIVLTKVTFTQVLLRRRVLMFIDNDSVRAALISGTTAAQASYDLLMEICAADAVTPAHTWYERVPSTSNPADAASRLRRTEVQERFGAEEVEVTWPEGLSRHVCGKGSAMA